MGWLVALAIPATVITACVCVIIAGGSGPHCRNCYHGYACHQHYRPGTDCAEDGCGCRKYRPPMPRRRVEATVSPLTPASPAPGQEAGDGT